MGRYLVRRFLFSLCTLFLLIGFGFFLVRFIPGNPFLQDETLDPLITQALTEQSGLQRPLFHQYWNYVTDLFKGHLGYSIDSPGTKVIYLIKDSFRWTLILAGWSFFISIFLSLILGVLVGGSKLRAAIFNPISLLVFCMPVLVCAPLFISIFALGLGWLPISRVDSWTGWILPVAIVSMRPVFKLSRILILEIRRVLATNATKTFRSLGFSDFKIRSVWALREALIGYTSYLGVTAVDLIGGSLLVEVMFGIPGLGLLLSQAINSRDYLVLTGLILVLGFLVLVIQFIVDLLICWIDPRVRL